VKYSLFHNIDKRRDDDNVWGEYRPGHRLTPYYAGEIDAVEPTSDLGEPRTVLERTAEKLFDRHNRDNRPCGRLAPSLSIGDVVVFHVDPDRAFAMAVALTGFAEVDVDTLVTLPEPYLEWLETERKERDALRH